MATQFPEVFAALAEPFPASEVKQRKGSNGRMLDYITSRVAMNRLDAVLGPEAWWDEYEVGRDNSLICKLSIRLTDPATRQPIVITKQGIGVTASSVGEDAEKGGEADAFKRAAVKFGVGRHLYKDGIPDYGPDHDDPSAPAPSSRPSGIPDGAPAPGNGNGHAQRGDRDDDRPPTTGRALFAWTKKQEERHQVGLLKYLNNWGKLSEFPGRMIDWDENQVAQGHAEAVRKLQSVLPEHASQEPARNTPTPSNGGLNTPATRQAEAAAILAQRKVLGGLMNQLMVAGNRTAETVRSDLDDAVSVALSGRVMSGRVNDCHDLALLAAYIETARAQLDTVGV